MIGATGEENSETGGIKTLKCPAYTIFSYLRLTEGPTGKTAVLYGSTG